MGVLREEAFGRSNKPLGRHGDNPVHPQHTGAAGLLSGPYAPNVYLVVDGGQGALIDAGYPDEGSVKARLEYLHGIGGLKLGTSSSPTTTSTTAAAPTPCARPPALASACTRGGTPPQRVAGRRPPGRVRRRARWPSGFGAWRRATAQTTADCLVQGGDTIQVGGVTIEVIDTPGHTLGSISLYLREERVLFTGDTVLGLGTVAIMPPPHGDMALYMQSLERLKGYEAALISPATGRPCGTSPASSRSSSTTARSGRGKSWRPSARDEGGWRRCWPSSTPSWTDAWWAWPAVSSSPTWRSWRAKAGSPAASDGDDSLYVLP